VEAERGEDGGGGAGDGGASALRRRVGPQVGVNVDDHGGAPYADAGVRSRCRALRPAE